MSKLNERWIVVQHGLLTRVSDNLLTLNAYRRLPFGDSTERTSVVQLAGRRLLICNPIALREEEMRKLEALGEPRYLLVPSEEHEAHALAWKARFPRAIVIAPARVIPRLGVELEARGPLDLEDTRVRLLEVLGTGERELAVLVESSEGKSLIVNEVMYNLPRARGLRGTLMRLLGYGPGAILPKVVRAKLVQDRTALRGQLEAWAHLLDLKRVVMSHGEALENPRNVLLQLAASFAGTGSASEDLARTLLV
ncbi:MAG: hypothetical protein QM778_32630 [Myxococcales bacterium]